MTEFQDKWNQILGLNFTVQKQKMQMSKFEGWSIQKLDIVEIQYKRFLFLWWKYPNMSVPPSEDVDIFWHYHILDTKKYHADCEDVFGTYWHHYPYFGLGSKEESIKLLEAFTQTLLLYEKEFGEELYDTEEIAVTHESKDITATSV